MKEAGISKQKLGAMLAPNLKTPQGRIKKINRILKEDNPKIEYEEVQMISQYFNKPVEWFFNEQPTQILDSETKIVWPQVPYLGAVSDAHIPWSTDTIQSHITYPFHDTSSVCDIFCVRMIGASMEGLIPHGAYIMVKHISYIEDLPAGKPVIYQIKKSLPHIALWYPNADGTITLKSPNPEFKPITTKPNVLSVLGVCTKVFTNL